MMARLKGWFYRALGWYLKLGLYTYFSKIELTGLENIPKDKPFILAVNHQSAFIDPIVANLPASIPCYYLTRSDIFTKWTSSFLEIIKMLPIYRMRDGIDQLGKNQEIFDHCARLFEKNESVLVFPEGNHGKYYYLRPLTKGTARIALYAQGKLKKELMVLPCGLNYFAHQTPRTKVIIVYGKPFSVKNYLADYHEDKQKGFRAFTQDLAVEMKKCLIIPEKTDDYDIKVKKVFNPENEVLSFAKLRKLADIDYEDDETQFVNTPKSTFQKNMIALASIPNFGPLLLLKKLLGGFKDKIFWPSVKYLVMVFIFPIWWIIGFLAGYFLFGVAEGFVMIALSIIGIFVRAELRK